MDLIEDIYRNSALLSEKSMCKDKQYKRAKNQVKQYYQNLSARLSDNELTILDKLMSYYDKQVDRKNVHCFKAGFETGLTITVESLK